jgi:2-phospho-L-lactate/phosphoenolpyruvate guanylyltransferase
MVSVVVPFRGAGGKHRLAPLPEPARAELALAMLGDVLAACVPVGATTVVTNDAAAAELASELGAAVIADPGGGQGAAVAAALAALRSEGPALVVNADLPLVRPADLLALLAVVPPGGLAYAPAADGTTNALALASPELFAPLYGAGSAARFVARAEQLGRGATAAPLPGLVADVDTLADLERAGDSLGARTRAALAVSAR